MAIPKYHYYSCNRVEIYALARHHIKQFEMTTPEKHPPWGIAPVLLEKHFEYVDRLIDKDIS